MFNLLPALLFLLVQGPTDPDARYARAEALILLVATSHLETEAPVAHSPAIQGDLLQDDKATPAQSQDQAPLPTGHGLLSTGFGTSQITRAGPAA